MRNYLPLFFILFLVVSGCAKQSPTEDGALAGNALNSSITTKAIKQSLTCITNGTDGYLVPYSIQYNLNTYSDESKIASCSVTKGDVRNLKCSSNDPFSMIYTVIAIWQRANGRKEPYDYTVSETLNPNESNCETVNY